MRASLYVLLPSWNVCRSYLFVWLFLHHSCYLELEPHKNFQTTRTGGGYSRPTNRLVRNLLLLTMTFLRKGLEWYENGKLLGFPGFDDPETIENQCAGQWVVCLTCHHSISVLGHPETRYWEEVFYAPLPCGRVSTTHAWRLGVFNPACHLGWLLYDDNTKVWLLVESVSLPLH